MKRLFALLAFFIAGMAFGQVPSDQPAKFPDGIATDSIFAVNDTVFVNDVLVYPDKIQQLANIDSLENYTGESTTVFVKDSLRGGIFNYVASGLNIDDGVVFAAADGGFWERKTENLLFVEWFGSNDGASFQKAMDYVSSNDKNRFTVSSKSDSIVVSTTVEWDVGNFNVDMMNTFIQPAAGVDSIPLVRITGQFESFEKKSLHYKMKFDGKEISRGITAVNLLAKLKGGSHKYDIINCDVGLHIRGVTEKQDIEIHIGNTKTGVLVERGGQIPGHDVTPDEINLEIFGGRCQTYLRTDHFGGSINILLNVEKQLNLNDDPAIVIENGLKYIKFSGELRGVEKNGIYINSTKGDIFFDDFNLFSVVEGYPILIERANLVSGSIFLNNYRDEPVQINSIRGGKLNISVGDQSSGLTPSGILRLGDISANSYVSGLTLFLSTYGISDANIAYALDISAIRNSQINYFSDYEKPIVLSGRMENSSLNLTSSALENNLGIVDTAFVSTGNHSINFIGGTTSTILNAYSSAIDGMNAENVTDKNSPSIYQNGQWTFFADAAAEPNVQSDWDETNTGSDAYILNKPSETAFSVYNQYSEVVINTTSETELITADTGVLNIANLNEGASYIGSLTGLFASGANDGQTLTFRIGIGNRDFFTQAINTGTQTGDIPVKVDYTINFPSNQIARITMFIQAGTESVATVQETVNIISIGNAFDFTLQLSGQTFTTYSSYLHKHVQ